ncbi:MAG: hypothetical protein FWE53_00250 [Firmicutes bacterium]|nr:hypothetical protein [Bacillota bacterium]
MNKIFAIISLGLVGALIAAVILMALVPVNFNLRLQDKPDLIRVYTNGSFSNDMNQRTLSPTVPAHKEAYDKILELYNDSGKFSTLNSLFLGLWGNSVEPSGLTSYKNVSSLSSSGTFVIEFLYNTSKKMLDNRGNTFVHGIGDVEQYYTRLFIPVANRDEVATLTYYVTNNTAADNPSMNLIYTAYANQAALHEYLATLFE